MKLNESQLQAVHHINGPLLIVAGAGTGKTTVITERIKYLIQDKKIDPQQIFAATFTEKAAAEMLSRLDVVMPLGYQEPWLGTFHGLCDRLLRFEGLEIGLNPNFKIMTQTDQWIFIREHLYDFNLSYYRPLGNPSKFISALIKFFSRIADENVSRETFQELAKTRRTSASTEEEEMEASRLTELAECYVSYQQLKREHMVMDFGDLITLSINLLETRPNIRKKYQTQFKYLLVDEFQDTNYAQFELLKRIAPPENNPNITVVGDDNQAVYKFRGASVSNILDFKNVYKNAKEIVLSDNYRSTQIILDRSYTSIKNNDPDTLEFKLGINKKLKSHKDNQHEISPKIIQFATTEEEVDWTVHQIIELVAKNELTYKDICVITRANSHLEPYANALKSAGLPYQLVANRGLFDQDEIKTLLNFLTVLSNPSDSSALIQLCISNTFNLNISLLLETLATAKSNSTNLWVEIQKSTDNEIQKIVHLISKYQELINVKSVSQLLHEFIEETEFLKPLMEVESLENQLKIKNLNLFFNQLKRYEITANDKSLLGFLSTLELWIEAGENPGQAQIEDIDTITLMTIHAAKGLEYEAVFVGSVISGRFPSNNRTDPIEMPVELIKEILPEGDEHLQEERRLFYVALTRAKRYLYLTYAEDVGGTRKRKMSGFLKETGIPVSQFESNNSSLTKSTTKITVPKFLDAGKYIIDNVSYSQIDTFELCPIKFKYRYLLQIPAKPHHSLSFGRTIHETLYEFHQRQLQGKLMSSIELFDLYKSNFIEEGYENTQHKNDRFKAGEEALTLYYNQYTQLFGKPVLLEQPFRLKLKNATLNGKIDRIDELKDGSLQIIDYKTGEQKKRDQKKIDKDNQLTIYALAAKEALNVSIKSMSLYFIEGGEKLTTTRTEEQLQAAKLKLESQISAMQTSDFPAKPDPVKCGFCEYRQLCPFASKKK